MLASDRHCSAIGFKEEMDAVAGIVAELKCEYGIGDQGEFLPVSKRHAPTERIGLPTEMVRYLNRFARDKANPT